MLFTKSILAPIDSGDGTRISIMSRHTLSDGVTSDPRITPERYSEHWVELAPPQKVIGDYYKRHLPWRMFEERYLQYLASDGAALKKVEELLHMARNGVVTVMCIEDVPTWCHRRLLAEFCKKRDPGIACLIF